MNLLEQWVKSFMQIMFPCHCAVCGDLLGGEECGICTRCFSSLPFTNIHGSRGNWFERYCWGQLPIHRASAFLKYLPSTDSRSPFVSMKYRNRPDLGELFGFLMAKELADTDFFSQIDYIVPIPLSEERFQQRGYNQSTALARGISKVTGIPIREDLVIRTVSNMSQTTLTTAERHENVKNIFEYVGGDVINDPHILLVDDIFTTGSTMFSCAKALSQISGISFSIIVLGISRQYPYNQSLDNINTEDPLSPIS
jgi:ComF family protein